MAHRRVAQAQGSPLGGGWGGAVLNLLFTVFVLAIVFGVLLIAVTITNTTLATTSGSTTAIGTTGTSALTVFQILVGYLVTLANFVGIMILLAIIVVVIAVLYVFFRPGGGLQGGM